MMAICKNVILQAKKGTSERKFLIAQSGAASSSPLPHRPIFPDPHLPISNPYRVTSRPGSRSHVAHPGGATKEGPTHSDQNPWGQVLGMQRGVDPHNSLAFSWWFLLIAVTHNYGVRLGCGSLLVFSSTHPAAGCSIFACLLCCLAILISLFGLLPPSFFFALL